MNGSPDPAAALALGLAVFPLDGRVPARSDWAVAGTRDLARIRAWPRGANIGVGCRANGLIVLDLDRHPGAADGVAAWARLRAAAGAGEPDTVRVHTPRGGIHLYFRAPQGFWFASGAVVPGIDARAPGRVSGGYVLGPGSVVAGRVYRAEGGVIAALPNWLVPLLPGRPAVSG
ncbi:bifunctional DNA primase/polymerase [Nocardia brasiliensis]|uniref:bifunctional DNA primase/polymerase n=1 Tax=Nocardia brasiliensis TaxID=37326 RepID=UPI002456FF2F|nr:bifunctional DNA primase/polymerase [Nocardia brasiliensis]